MDPEMMRVAAGWDGDRRWDRVGWDGGNGRVNGVVSGWGWDGLFQSNGQQEQDGQDDEAVELA